MNLTQDQLHLNVVELEAFDNWLESLALACTTNKITTLNQVLAEKFNSKKKYDRKTREYPINKRSKILFTKLVEVESVHRTTKFVWIFF